MGFEYSLVASKIWGGNPATFTTSAPVVCDGTITSSSSKVKADD